MAAAVQTVDPLSDDEAFIEQYDSHCRKVSRAIRRLYRLSREDEQDLTQTLRMKLLTISLENRRKGAGYVKMCVNNAARDELKRHLDREDINLPAFADVLDHAKARDETRGIDELMSVLSPAQREIVELSLGLYTPVRAPRTIAKAAGISIEAIEPEFTEALARMRNLSASAARGDMSNRVFTAEQLQRVFTAAEEDSMIYGIRKPQASIEKFTIDWSQVLGGSDTISASTWSVAPDDMTATSDGFSATTAYTTLSGGTLGTYVATNTVTLASGQVKVQSLLIDVGE